MVCSLSDGDSCRIRSCDSLSQSISSGCTLRGAAVHALLKKFLAPQLAVGVLGGERGDPVGEPGVEVATE